MRGRMTGAVGIYTCIDIDCAACSLHVFDRFLKGMLSESREVWLPNNGETMATSMETS